jgi:hypothetical protein
MRHTTIVIIVAVMVVMVGLRGGVDLAQEPGGGGVSLGPEQT